jgi:glutamate synthase domain-containing protein 3
MTGGLAVILGPVGLNFGSGMTGGLAYILRSEAEHVLNMEFVQAYDLEHEEESHLRRLLESHFALTDSPLALRLLTWRSSLPFVRIQPIHFQGTIESAWLAVSNAVSPALSSAVPHYLGASAGAAPHYA